MSKPDQTSQSEQRTGDDEFQNLARQYFSSIYRLALATLQDSEIARRATEQTLVSALLDFRHRQSSDEIKLWLFSLALRVVHGEERRLHRKPVSQTSAEKWETGLWQMVDGFGAKEHDLCLLYYLLGFKIPEIAALLHVGQSAVRAQLEIFRGKFKQILAGANIRGSKEVAAPGTTGVPPSKEKAVEFQRTIEARVAASLQRRWPVPQLSPDELEQAIGKVRLLAEKERARQRQTTPYKWLALASGIVILAAICVSWGILAWLSSSRQAANATQSTQWNPQSGSPLAKAKELSRNSDSETILLRLKEGPLLWKTLWIDVQIVAYGPQSYVGLPKAYRAQAWINQPDQSLELFGLLSESPNSISMVEEGKRYYINPVLKVARTGDWEGNPPKEYSGGKLLSNASLRSMVFPGSEDLWLGESEPGSGTLAGFGSIWIKEKGTFKTVKYDRVAGRRAIVVDWFNPKKNKEASLWLDVHTGLVLRLQMYGGADFQTLTYEAIVTEIIYNQPNPPPRLSDALKLKEPETYIEWERIPTAQETAIFTATAALSLITRPEIYHETAPVGFDPSNSSLVFQFPQDPGIMNTITNTAEIPSALIADDYLLDVIKFGLPWVLHCDRSPDGQRLAFNTGTDGTAPADDSLHWFNLKEPQAIYQPLPGFHAASFVFAPDSHRLAVFGYGEGQLERGIYILDIGTGEYELLTSLINARSLVWSPDGEYLAFIGAATEDDNPEVTVIYVNTAQIAYQGKIEFLEGVTYAIGPIAGWEIEFPVETGGMDRCAAPP